MRIRRVSVKDGKLSYQDINERPEDESIQDSDDELVWPRPDIDWGDPGDPVSRRILDS